MADIFQEVEEDLKRERVELLWKKYGKWVIAAAVAVVLATAGFQLWNNYQQTVRSEKSAQFSQAFELSEAGKLDEAKTALAELAASDDGYGTLARFEQARILAEQGDIASAVALWDQIAASSPPIERLQDVASLLAVMHLVETGDVADVKKRLALLVVPGAAFRYSAIELQALVALREDDHTSARSFFQQLVDAPDAPGGIQSRAAQILETLAE
ncbi:tetratricopeptide repeat protein [Kiloniella laminariae]|uniref:tetratricopeptide repeat protein n=1 Tax=Kiloniella laminariae TaxID=454162 RepID=UPI00036F71BA|nr:tetratricopeptide repeat protein [Kiloniella laminariae]